MSDEQLALSLTEHSALEAYEGIITEGLHTFVAVGHALLAIREQRLYRAEYATFEDYCRERWALERRRAYQLMDAATVVGHISDDVKKFSHHTLEQAKEFIQRWATWAQAHPHRVMSPLRLVRGDRLA